MDHARGEDRQVDLKERVPLAGVGEILAEKIAGDVERGDVADPSDSKPDPIHESGRYRSLTRTSRTRGVAGA